MNHAHNALQNNTLSAAPSHVVSAIKQASHSSGVDFSYLVNQAKAESSFNPHAKAKTSSATGLYQFIDSTWMQMIERYGEDYGLSTEGKSEKEILNMRKDPKAASFMAAAFASENEKFLDTHWGGNVGATELYFAHFLGASGAASFLNAKDENALRPAADLFPQAARANRNVFYDQDTGKPRSIAQVYDVFDKKFNNPHNAPATQTNTLVANTSGIPQDDRPNFNQITRSYGISNNMVSQRSQAMRNNNYGGVDNNYIDRLLAFGAAQSPKPSSAATPFFSLIAKPVDLMLLTQTTTPEKVVRDNG